MPGVARGLYLDLSQCFVKCFVLACIFRFKGKQLVTKHGVGVGSRLKETDCTGQFFQCQFGSQDAQLIAMIELVWLCC